MAGPFTIVAIAGLALSAFSTIKQIEARKDAAKESKKQARASTAEQRRRRLRQMAIARAQAENAGTQVSGSVGNVTASQAGRQAGDYGPLAFNESMLNSNIRMANAQTRAAGFGALGSIGGTLASTAISAGAFQGNPNNTTALSPFGSNPNRLSMMNSR